jgi:hypothetical protein
MKSHQSSITDEKNLSHFLNLAGIASDEEDEDVLAIFQETQQIIRKSFKARS